MIITRNNSAYLASLRKNKRHLDGHVYRQVETRGDLEAERVPYRYVYLEKEEYINMMVSTNYTIDPDTGVLKASTLYFDVDIQTGMLLVDMVDGNTKPDFFLNEETGELEVIINGQ